VLIPGPPTNDPTRTVFGAVGAVIFFGCVGFFALSWLVDSARAARERQSALSVQQDMNDIDDMFTSSPQIDAIPRWNSDELQMKLVFASQKPSFNGLTIQSVLLDNYIPDVKFPKKVPEFDPKHPAVIVVGFPGFDGRGGKYAHVHVNYSSTGPMPGEKMVKRNEEEMQRRMGGAPFIEGESSGWTSSADPQILIPLRAKYQKRG